MDGKIFDAPFFEKHHTTAVSAFKPINGHAVGKISNWPKPMSHLWAPRISIKHPPELPPKSFDVAELENLPLVKIVRCQPGISDEIMIKDIKRAFEEEMWLADRSEPAQQLSTAFALAEDEYRAQGTFSSYKLMATSSPEFGAPPIIVDGAVKHVVT